jgi:biopolymer transport protein ExbB/TolQ
VTLLVPSLWPLANILFAFQESNFAGKVIVGILFVGSIFAWSIMVSKVAELRKAMRESDLFLVDFRKSHHPASIFLKKRRYPESPLYKVYASGCLTIGQELEWSESGEADFFDDITKARLSRRQVDSVRNAADSAVADQLLLLESYMGSLATAVSASPFLGLLGTVWGVMAAFSGMAVAGSSSLSAVAPGIAGALLTTVVGLLVALPSSIGYNMLTSMIRRLHVQMDNFAQEFSSEVHRALGPD